MVQNRTIHNANESRLCRRTFQLAQNDAPRSVRFTLNQLILHGQTFKRFLTENSLQNVYLSKNIAVHAWVIMALSVCSEQVFLLPLHLFPLCFELGYSPRWFRLGFRLFRCGGQVRNLGSCWSRRGFTGQLRCTFSFLCPSFNNCSGERLKGKQNN